MFAWNTALTGDGKGTMGRVGVSGCGCLPLWGDKIYDWVRVLNTWEYGLGSPPENVAKAIGTGGHR